MNNTFRQTFRELFMKYKRRGYDDFTARFLTYRDLK